MAEKIFGLDIGGTNMRLGIVSDYKIIDLIAEPIRDQHDEKGTIKQLIEMISSRMNAEVEAIGVGVPSVVDPIKGIVYDVVNIPSWKEVHLKEILEREFSRPVFINNDANCFALGEKYFGHGRNINDMVGLISGTGTGAGIISNGKLVNGKNCGAGEFGMVGYRDSIYEQYCSGQFFPFAYGITALEAYERAIRGDAEAREMWRVFGSHFGELIKMILFVVDPEVIVLGGSVSNAFELFRESMYACIDNFAFPQSLKSLVIKTSQLDNAGILGAASLYFDHSGTK